MNRDQFLKKIDSFNDELINLRRHIHAHPELSGLENQTAILISGFLKNLGWNKKYTIENGLDDLIKFYLDDYE